MVTDDTIVAVSSAVGPAARMIVRLSGPDSFKLAEGVCPGLVPAPSASQFTGLRLRAFAATIPATIYTFVAPHSYTGEHLTEFHIPGNPLLAKLLMTDLCAAGARPAEAGEFTARAYFNNRIDLTEAEGVAATIAAQNDDELWAARQLLAGELAKRLGPIMSNIAQTLALIEVGIDFTEEDVTFLEPREIHARTSEANQQLATLVNESSRFEKLSHEPRVVLIGRPNAGKSTLLNTLAGHERAVVSPIAGTTRDVLSAQVKLTRGTIILLDVAGLESNQIDATTAAGNAANLAVHNSMRDRAMRELETADYVVLVHDPLAGEPELPLPRPADLKVYSKADLSPDFPVPENVLRVSTHTGLNLDTLRAKLDAIAFGHGRGGSSLALNARHVLAIGEARIALERVCQGTSGSHSTAAEFLAGDLRTALDSLGQILGDITPDELLGRIFSAFCIGK